MRAKSGWYGQVVQHLGRGLYRVRIGGTNSTRDLPEADLEFQMGRSIAPRVFPPVRILSTSITAPAFAYPFSNEKGFASDKPLWTSLGNIQPGAVVGVSGSVLDLAAFAGQACLQIVSTDINSCTTNYINQLRKILVLLSEVGEIKIVKRHWKSQTVISTTTTGKVAFFKEVLAYIQNHNLKLMDFVDTCEFQHPAGSLRKELGEFETLMKISVTTYFSSWYKTLSNFEQLTALVKQGKSFLLCGDLSNVETLAALREVLDYPITVFNISNALDYIRNLDPLINMFVSFPHTDSAKVVSSSQSTNSQCDALLGTFEVPKVHEWEDFVNVLRQLKARSLSGALSGT